MSSRIKHRQIDTLATLWARPKNAHASDEEFDGDGSLPSGWVESEAVSGTIDPYSGFSSGDDHREINGWRKSCYAIQPVSGQTMWLSKGITVPTNLFMWARASFSYRYGASNNNDASLGLVLSATSGGEVDYNNRIVVYFQESDGNDIQMQVVRTTGGSGSTVVTTTDKGITGAGQYYEYVGIQKVGTTFYFWAFSHNGQMYYMGTTTSSIAFDRVGFLFGNNVTTAPGNSIMTADFIRFKEGVVFLPGYGN